MAECHHGLDSKEVGFLKENPHNEAEQNNTRLLMVSATGQPGMSARDTGESLKPLDFTAPH